MAHIHNYTQLTVYGSMPHLYNIMYKLMHKRESDGSREIQCLGTGVVHYLGTGTSICIYRHDMFMYVKD